MIAGLVLLLLLAPQELQEDDGVAYGNLLFKYPAGWKFEVKEESLLLRPGDLGEREAFVVMLFPAGNAEGTLEEALEKAWKHAAGTSTITRKAPGKELKTEGGIDGLMSVGMLETAEGIRLIAAVAVFKAGDRSQMVLALCPQDAVFQRYTEHFGALLKALRFRNLELPAYELLMSSAAPPKFTALFKDGTWLGTLPAEGLDGFNPRSAPAKLPPDAWGTAKVKDGVIEAGRTTLKPSGEGTYAAQDGTTYTRVGASTGLRLQGRYLRQGGEDKPETPCFGFKADGTFEDLGAGKLVAPGAPAESATGTGGYEIFNNTLYLTYRDKRRRKTSWVSEARAGNEKAPEWIVVGGVRFDRR